MRASDNDFAFSPNFNFGVDNLFITQNNELDLTPPPVSGQMLLLDNTPMLLLDNTDMLLL